MKEASKPQSTTPSPRVGGERPFRESSTENPTQNFFFFKTSLAQGRSQTKNYSIEPYPFSNNTIPSFAAYSEAGLSIAEHPCFLALENCNA